MSAAATQVFDGVTLIGWVQKVDGRWLSRSIETGSTTTSHDTESTARALLLAAHAGREQAKTAPPVTDDQKRRLRAALMPEPIRPEGAR